ncbi:chemotaxis protein CheX [Oleiharenicola sp. Vm1]|uniref:chemotaxis protein CheX n=1 Tax=Oleiharenicola sp. Vm1 TaxID=3398393 RepID=UPI0039F5B6AE
MAAAQQITDALIQESIANAMQNVCRTLLRQDAPFVDRAVVAELERDPLRFQLIGNVGFAGEANGMVYLCMSDDFALYAVSTILGMSRAEVEFHGPDVVKDAIGELTNMTVGGFKNSLCDVGFPCKLTLPTIVRGHNLTVAALKGTTRHVFRFTCATHVLVADIQLKSD